MVTKRKATTKAQAKPDVKDTRKKVSKDMLRRFAAEIKLCTNFPLSDKIVEQAIKDFERKEGL